MEKGPLPALGCPAVHVRAGGVGIRRGNRGWHEGASGLPGSVRRP